MVSRLDLIICNTWKHYESTLWVPFLEFLKKKVFFSLCEEWGGLRGDEGIFWSGDVEIGNSLKNMFSVWNWDLVLKAIWHFYFLERYFVGCGFCGEVKCVCKVFLVLGLESLWKHFDITWVNILRADVTKCRIIDDQRCSSHSSCLTLILKGYCCNIFSRETLLLKCLHHFQSNDFSGKWKRRKVTKILALMREIKSNCSNTLVLPHFLFD